MRIEAFEIRNYKGIALARLEGLSAEAVVTISGRNGTGKSLLLEALVGVWSGRHSMTSRVGPWADTLSVSITVNLTTDERHAVNDWHQRLNGTPAPQNDTLTYTITADKAGQTSATADNSTLQALRNPGFQREHPFSVMDLLPADRLVQHAPAPSVDIGMMSQERVEQERQRTLDQLINYRSPLSLPSVSNYLLTLDYQAFIASRQGLHLENEYDKLAKTFYDCTGKRLLAPEYDPAGGSAIQIELLTGKRHVIADLSSGEQELLAMMYFVRRLSAAGGILCIDEPEQHLHPTLQAALFQSMQELATRAQVLVVSHSVNLVSAAPVSALIQVTAPQDASANQALRLTDQPGKAELVAALGITPADLLQNDLLLVVEGETDSTWLRAMFPVELGRAHIVIAGSSGQALDMEKTLTSIPAGLPWLCLLDRDLREDSEVRELTTRHSNLHVWPKRALESMLLEPELIAAALGAVGQAVAIAEVEEWLADAAGDLKAEVVGNLVDRALGKEHPAPATREGLGRYERLKAHLRDYAEVNRQRADAVDSTFARITAEVDQQWTERRYVVVNPKPLAAKLHQRADVFKTSADLLMALATRAKDDPAVRPTGLEAFRLRIEMLVQGT